MDNGPITPLDPKIVESLEIIRVWLKKQPHMPQDIDDELLLPFIFGTKSIEIAKQKLECFCIMHNRYPDSFSFKYRDPLDPVLQDRYKMGRMFILPKKTPEGWLVMMGINLDFERFDGFWSNVIMSMVLESAMMLYPQNPGLFLTFDCNGVDSRIMTKFGIPTMTFFLQYLQSCIPLKMKKMIVYNTPTFFDVFVNTIVKPYAKKKLFDRIVFSSKGEEVLKEYLPVDILPCDIDGGKDISTAEIDAHWKKILLSRRDYFRNAPNMATDETKRLPDSAHTFGVDGTFRVLSVD